MLHPKNKIGEKNQLRNKRNWSKSKKLLIFFIFESHYEYKFEVKWQLQSFITSRKN